ncbi:MAG: LamG-like jellyroll fold domain-containing protein [Candidatus Microsaccharimonas sp.]
MGTGHLPSRFRATGFTIVELLIVIVVIAILAAITIVAFNGVQNRAKVSALQSDIAGAVRSVEASKAGSTTERYPASASAASLRSSSANTLSYFYDDVLNQYCIEGVNGTLRYYASSTSKSPQSGRCTEQGLIGWWPFNNSLNDQGSLNLATSGTNMTFTQGQNGTANGAAVFNGTSSGITATHNAALHPDAMTLSLWINPSTWATAEATTSFISKRVGANNGYFFHKLSTAAGMSLDIGNTSTRWSTGLTPSTSQWTHVVMTMNASGRSYYSNGALQQTVTSAAYANPIVPTTSDLRIGVDSATAYRYTGAMDDVRIYNRSLGADEIGALYAQGAQ